jgi:hypothetical protein
MHSITLIFGRSGRYITGIMWCELQALTPFSSEDIRGQKSNPELKEHITAFHYSPRILNPEP